MFVNISLNMSHYSVRISGHVARNDKNTCFDHHIAKKFRGRCKEPTRFSYLNATVLKLIEKIFPVLL